MECPKCHSGVYDNRPKKLTGEFKPNAPDFKCQNKACDWKQWPPKAQASPVATAAPIAPPSAPQAHGNGSGRDAQLVALYWACFDEILEGVARRKLTDLFKPEHLMAATSTLYIQRARG